MPEKRFIPRGIESIRINHKLLYNRNSMENYFNNVSLVKIVAKWKWHFFIIGVVAAVFAFIFSSPLFITPKYKSMAVIYPSNIADYSGESESEQMLQWLNSQDIKDSVMRRFDLPAHYGIDTAYRYFKSTMQYLYNENVKISKTMYESVEIEVLDADPVLARDMVNAIMDFCNKKINTIHNSKYREVVDANKRILDIKKLEMDSAQSKLAALGRKYNLVDYDNQSLEITKGYLRTVEGGSNINTKDVLRLKKNFEEKGGELVLGKERLVNLATEYSNLMELYDKARFDAEKKYTFINVITKPQLADRKAYPIRWLIMLYVVAATLFFSLVVISVIDTRQRRNPEKPADL